MMSRKSSIDGYEKLKTVGKGAFGTATLYRRIRDDKSVVMKEIFMNDLTKGEKSAALNEITIISSLNHPNIIRYIGNFENQDSIVIIMEYADGGNLAQLISAKKEKHDLFREKTIVNVFSQITNAVGYMHNKKILHRDLKAANVFLNKHGTVKVGDFGISKILTTRSQAQTVVGTPYYLSPEICEGNDYNEKSDIWAMGCILYEMVCLKKPFEARTLPVLVQKITNCEYEEIPKQYSSGLSKLVNVILQKDYQKRPSAQYINNTIIPSLQFDDINYVTNSELERSSLCSLFDTSCNVNDQRSLLYSLDLLKNGLTLDPIKLPHKNIIDYSASQTHFIVITADKLVYSWGNNNHGQLGHGELSSFRKYPICVNYLRHKNIINCSAGDDYSIFLNVNGVLFSCGSGSKGCLGLGNYNSTSAPTIISSMLTFHITQISCSSDHILALSSDGNVFSWGSSQYGQLGQGHTQYCCTPAVIKIPELCQIKNVYTGISTSMLLTTDGQILACGSNKYNKLGFQDENIITVFRIVQSIRDKIKSIALGVNHTILITVDGKAITIGRNFEGQLGKGNFYSYAKPQYVTIAENVMMASCGSTYSLAVTEKNTVMIWGSYSLNIDKQNNEMNQEIGYTTQSAMTLLYSPLTQFSTSTNNSKNNNLFKVFKSPTHVLALYASSENIKSNNILWLGGIKTSNNNILMLVHTTVPPPKKNINEYSTFNSSKAKSHVQVAPSKLTYLPKTLQLI